MISTKDAVAAMEDYVAAGDRVVHLRELLREAEAAEARCAKRCEQIASERPAGYAETNSAKG